MSKAKLSANTPHPSRWHILPSSLQTGSSARLRLFCSWEGDFDIRSDREPSDPRDSLRDVWLSWMVYQHIPMYGSQPEKDGSFSIQLKLIFLEDPFES